MNDETCISCCCFRFVQGLDLSRAQVYNLDGSFLTQVQVIQLYKDTFDRFKTDYPDFTGAKIIFAPLRRVDNATMTSYVQLASQLKVGLVYS